MDRYLFISSFVQYTLNVSNFKNNYILTSGQSTAWPNCVKTLTNWFSDQQRMTVFGLFGTSSFAGGILGTAMAVSKI